MASLPPVSSTASPSLSNVDHALFTAVVNNLVNDVRFQISKGANVNLICGNRSQTPLISFAKSAEVFKLLLEGGVRADALNKEGEIPLHFAAHKGFTDCLDLLIEKGSNINHRSTPAGETPLLKALMVGQEKFAIALLQKGADPDIQNTRGENAAHIAALNRCEGFLKALLKEKAEKREPFPSINAQSLQYYTPLHYAVLGNITSETLRLFLEVRANPNCQTKELQRTPFHLAVLHGRSGYIPLLKEFQGNPNLRDSGGWTPLAHAASLGNTVFIQILLGRTPRQE